MILFILIFGSALSQVSCDLPLPEVPLPPEVYGGSRVVPVSLAPRPRLVGVRFLQKPRPLLPRLVGIRFLQRPLLSRPRFVGIRFIRRPEPIRPRLVGIRFIRKPVPNRPRLVGIRFLRRLKPNRPRLVGIRYVNKYRPLLLAGLQAGFSTPMSPMIQPIATRFGGFSRPIENTIRIVNYKMPFQPHIRAFPYPYRPTSTTMSTNMPTYTNGPFGHGRYQHYRHPYLPQSTTSFEASKPIVVRPPAIPQNVQNNGKAPIYLVQTKVSAPVFIMPNHGTTLSKTVSTPSIMAIPPTASFTAFQNFLPKYKPTIGIQSTHLANAIRMATLQGRAVAAQTARLPPVPVVD